MILETVWEHLGPWIHLLLLSTVRPQLVHGCTGPAFTVLQLPGLCTAFGLLNTRRVRELVNTPGMTAQLEL